MVVIKKYNNIIPIDFGEFQLEFKVSDSKIKDFERIAQEVKVYEKKTDLTIAESLEVIKKYWTDLFDEVSFEKVYEFSDKSTVDTIYYLAQTISGITEELQERFQPNKKYF